MASLRDLVFEIFELFKGQITDDEVLDPRFISRNIHTQRALYLRNEFNKNRTIDSRVIQDLGCVELETIDQSECAELCSSLEIGCSIKRTKLTIPQTIERHNDTTIIRVAPVGRMNISFSFVPYQRAIFSGYGRFNKNRIFGFLWNEHVYIISNNNSTAFRGLKYINVQGVFEDPSLVSSFTTCTGTSCYSDENDYPLNDWMWNYIKIEVLKMIGIKLSAPTDIVNDGSNTQQQINPNIQRVAQQQEVQQ